VNPSKLGGIEAAFQGFHRFAQKMNSRACVELRVVPGRGNPFDILD